MFLFFVVLVLLLSLALVGVVLIQNSKGQGINPSFGSLGGGTQIFGVRRTGDVLERSTWVIGLSFLGLCLLANLFLPGDRAAVDVIQQGAAQQQQAAPAPQTPPGSAIPSQQQLEDAPATTTPAPVARP